MCPAHGPEYSVPGDRLYTVVSGLGDREELSCQGKTKSEIFQIPFTPTKESMGRMLILIILLGYDM